jgi:hypothetical protein
MFIMNFKPAHHRNDVYFPMYCDLITPNFENFLMVQRFIIADSDCLNDE